MLSLPLHRGSAAMPLLALYAVTVAAATAAQQPDTALWTRLRYRFVGPEGNRAVAATGEPGNPLVAYVGAAAGGTWKPEGGGGGGGAARAPRQAAGALRGGRGGGHLEDRGRRRALARGVRQPAGAGDRRAGAGAVGPQRPLGRDRRDLLHPLDPRAGYRRVPLDRRGPQLATPGARRHGAHRAHRDPSREPRCGAGVRAGTGVRAGPGPRRVPHRRRRQDVDPRAVRRREYGVLRPGDRSGRPEYAVRRHVAIRSEDLAPAERRAGERAVGVARRRGDMEAAGGTRAPGGRARGR